ncbi:MAG: prephenate dehydratase domain-containing protein, partial [Fibrobacter sp.]|nr:prephenate dehydratase domain-containing protein [Fibrobacter sp.]
MELLEVREKINVIDAEMVQLFQKRMELTQEIAKCKKKHNLPFFDGARERELLNRVAELSGEEIERYTRVMFTTLMDLSKSYQHRLVDPPSATEILISSTLKETPMLFPEKAAVACQGVEGAYSQMACERLFLSPTITYFNQFDGVFKAVDKGECEYGILPLENSTAGSVNAIYDLMQKYRFYIVRTCRLQIDHALLCNKGVSIGDIKEVISHEQGLLQCSEFLKTMPGIKVTVCANTAMASRIVAESGRKDLAAISSRR